ncbi:MAG TPA: ABC transporter permease [Bryobacteraceae bacterium]|nr:ABC transporter permease [Bryobacteraceae bacterium]
MQDLKYALRLLWKAKAFTVVAVLTLAIGVGANTAIFSIIDTILLRPLPFHNPGELVRLFETEAAPGTYPFAGPDLGDWRAQNHTFGDMAMYGWVHDLNASREGRADHLQGVPTEANFFDLLGVHPLLGRTWMPGEGQPGKERVTVLSYALWQSRFAGNPEILNQTIDLDAREYTIIGVMPPSFRYPTRAQLWFPEEMVKNDFPRGSHWASAIGRMKPGVTIKQAQAELTVIAAALEKAYPDSNYKVGAKVVSLRDNVIGDSRASLLMMLWAVALVLMIACANVANLLLSRAVARQKEIAVRSALGAGRGRLVRQLLTESVLLALAGGAVGLGLGWSLVSLFSKLKSFALPQFNVIELNGAVLAFTFGLALAAGILFGLVPAIQSSRPDLHDELKGGAGSSISPSRGRRMATNILVVSEVALSLLLLSGAGLLLKDFVRLRSLDVGVRPDGVWTATVQLPKARYEKTLQQRELAMSLLDKMQHMPGIDAAALSSKLPLEGGSNGYVKVRGKPSTPMSGPLVEVHSISPAYFRAMGVPLISGRVFDDTDVKRAAALDDVASEARRKKEKLSPEQTNNTVYPAVINRSMQRQFWPNEGAIGKMFSFGADNGPWQEVIGVVGDVKQWGLTHAPVPEAYSAYTGDSGFYIVLHTPMQPTSVSTEVRQALAQADSTLPLFNVRTMEEVIGDSAQGTQFLSLLVGSFAVFAALLAAIGIYGVLSYAVSQRTREIGIRLSLGASRGRVLSQMLGEGMRLAGAGFVIGIAGAIAAGRVMASLLHEVKPQDPAVLTITTALLAVIALAACWLPAWRAARLDPTSALRHD